MQIKMRDVFLLVTAIFWAGVAYYALRPEQPGGVKGGGGVSVYTEPKLRIARKPDLPVKDVAELAKHATPEDCWIAIDGIIFDLTPYVDLHPSKQNEMEKYCGKDGTQPWDAKDAGKDKGKSHTKRALEFLGEYPQVGVLR